MNDEDKKGIDGRAVSVGKVLETDLYVKRNIFRSLRQSSAMNQISMLNTKGLSAADDTDILCIERGNLKLFFENFSALPSGLRTTTHRLLDAMLIRFTESGAKNPEISLSLEEYMELCGLKNQQETRQQINSDIKTLKHMYVDFRQSSGRECSMQHVCICTDMKIKNSIIYLTLSPEFFRVMKTMPVMPYPEELFRINLKQNPNSYYFLKKIAEHKKMNYFKKNADIISVQTLLQCTPELPDYNTVIHTDRAVDRRIIRPFERDMDLFSDFDILQWQYCHTNGLILTEEEVNNLNYHIFYRLLVKIHWKNYPEQQKKGRTK